VARAYRATNGANAIWSPDSTRLAFQRIAKDVKRPGEGDPVVEIWTIRIDGSEPRRVVPRGSQWDIAWTR
jgi:Tol biopolymer transport system component